MARWVVQSLMEGELDPEPAVLKKEVDKIRAACDKDGSGSIDMHEFVNYYKRLASALDAVSPQTPGGSSLRGTPTGAKSVDDTAVTQRPPSIDIGKPEQAPGASAAEQRAEERRERIAARTAREQEKKRLQQREQTEADAEASDEGSSADFHSDYGDH